MKWVAAIGVALVGLGGCGESPEDEFNKGYVSVEQAQLFFEVHTGQVGACWPHERMDFTEWQLAGEPEAAIWGSVSCRITKPYLAAVEDHIYPGEVLTYGIP